MSRWYRMALIVSKSKLTVEELTAIRKIFNDNWDNDDGYLHDGKDYQEATFSGENNLCGGESDEEAHARFRDMVKEAVPNCSVTTEWTYLEDLPYETYTD